MLAVRATFFMGLGGALRAMVCCPMDNGRSIDEFSPLLQAPQASEVNEVARPVGWKPGQVLIVLAPRSSPENSQTMCIPQCRAPERSSSGSRRPVASGSIKAQQLAERSLR